MTGGTSSTAIRLLIMIRQSFGYTSVSSRLTWSTVCSNRWTTLISLTQLTSKLIVLSIKMYTLSDLCIRVLSTFIFLGKRSLNGVSTMFVIDKIQRLSSNRSNSLMLSSSHVLMNALPGKPESRSSLFPKGFAPGHTSPIRGRPDLAFPKLPYR